MQLSRRNTLAVLAGAAIPARLSAQAPSAPQLTLESTGSAYLQALRRDYRLDAIADGAGSDVERVRRLAHWVHRQWEHGQNMPSKLDARTILAESKSKGGFRCTEFAQVLAAAASAIGIPARPVSILTADAATSGSAHVVTEAYDRRRRKWFHADAQFDLLMQAYGEPANVAECSRAFASGVARAVSGSGRTLADYREFVTPYLFHYNVPIDTSFDPERKARGGSRELTYSPPGAPPLLQVGGWKLRGAWTSELTDFYRAPSLT